MFNKKMLLATAILACSMSSVAMASDLELHGYAKTGITLDSDLSSGGNNFGKGDFFLGTNGSNPANQFELVGTKRFSSDNGAQGRLDFRLEYGNGTPGETYYYSSSGGEGKENFFELKEAYVTLEKLDFLPEGSSVWAGRKFYGRDSTANSGEFWKQSSGVGFGYETSKFAMAVVGADSDKSTKDGDRQTALVLDTRIKNIQVPGGSLEAQVNLYVQKNAKDEVENDKGVVIGYPDAAETGIGMGLTYNINKWYGIKDGWSKAAITMGTGLGGANACGGLNFGSWTADGKKHKDAKALFATTYGLVNLSDKLQMGTEFSYLQGDKMFGTSEGTITRTGATIAPSYKVSKNLRLTAEASIGMQKLPKSVRDAWTKPADYKETEIRTALTLAPVITLNNDFYGRPQIKPFVTFGQTNNNSNKIYDNKKSATLFGVVGEVWF